VSRADRLAGPRTSRSAKSFAAALRAATLLAATLLAATLLAATLLAATAARADERILVYDAEITVNADSSLDVRETIRVRAEGANIRRGIYRDFPTVYPGRDGRRVTTGFDLLSLSRDGRPEPHRIERVENGVRVYAGDANVLLDPGEYTYELRYRTDRQLGFFETHDELYWNVTGNGWLFAIDAVTARVRLPAPATDPPNAIAPADLRMEAYTGPQGTRGSDYVVRLDETDPAHPMPFFFTTRPLAPEEGLTIVVGWPKGHVTPPTGASAYRYALRDSLPLVLALTGLLILLGYYTGIWYRVGQDPPGRVVVPHYEPPEGQSPASMRFLARMRYDDRCFAAAVLSLAVKGHLVIEQASSGLLGLGREFALVRQRKTQVQPMSEDEAALMQAVFGLRERLELKDANHATISDARSRHHSALKKRYMPNFFRVNGGWQALGVAVSIVLVALVVWRAVAGHFTPEWFLVTLNGQLTILFLLLALLSNGIYAWLLKAPTVAGRDAMDRIEGFKLYLDVAEGDELKLQGAPALTARLFESYLPAALALGVEQHWAERFAEVFATSDPNQTPVWYHGDRWTPRNVSGFSSRLGSSLSSAISSSATAPGSSSGGGGGGSSGGGGGGGGGGGW